MAHTLISFLGANSGPDRRGYRPARYDFGGGATEPTPFFALALLRYLRGTPAARPDRLVVLGTPGSMWDTFVYPNVTHDGDADERTWLDLSDAVLENHATQPMLDGYRARLSAALEIDSELILIPYARNEVEQIGVLRILRETLRPGELVTLDLTHGLRHLPILGMVSALLLEATRDAIIGQIYYGALELTPRQPGPPPPAGPAAAVPATPPPEPELTPVLRLTGLVRVGRWLAAFQVFDDSGDYGVFAPLLREDGGSKEITRLLREAAFLAKMSRLEEAQTKLVAFRRRLVQESSRMPMMRLFGPVLEKRFAWAEAGDSYQRLRDLALANFEDGDYARAAVRGFEAFLLRLPAPPAAWMESDRTGGRAKPNPEKRYYEHRGGRLVHGTTGRPIYEAFVTLRDIRNTVVHGTVGDNAEALKALRSLNACEIALTRLFKVLLPEPTSPGRILKY